MEVTMSGSDMVIDNTYQIVNRIASGGMGVIYLAYHLRLQKYVVLKMIKNTSADVNFLRNEVDILKSLHHIYLPQVYDFITYNERIFTVIDYIEGYDLNYYIETGYDFSEELIVKWLKQLCEVLIYLHSQPHRILHTDIKPANIIVTPDFDICLIDFGVSLYDTNVIKGMSDYFSSPEQYGNFLYLKYGQGNYTELDVQTDIYSLAATFYYIMTGIKPSVTDGCVPITEYDLPYSEGLLNIIQKAMELLPENRYEDVASMLKALENLKKNTALYKKLFAARIGAAVLSGLMVVSGIAMIISGYNDSVRGDYERDYNAFIQAYESGNSNLATEKGLSLVNSSKYSSVISSDTRAEIFHGVGDCFYDEGKYSDACRYYKLALDNTDDSADIYYRDYAFALIREDRVNDAMDALNSIKQKVPDSPAIKLVEAELKYKNDDCDTAISYANECIPRLGDDSDSKYTAYRIIGDSYNKKGDYTGAANAYKNAKDIKENASILRKLGAAYLNEAVAKSSSSSYYKAQSCFKRLCDDYFATDSDKVYYAQCAVMLDDTSKYEYCKKQLEVIENKKLSAYIMLAILGDLTSDNNTLEYCEKAQSMFESTPYSERELIDESCLSKLKEIYGRYH